MGIGPICQINSVSLLCLLGLHQQRIEPVSCSTKVMSKKKHTTVPDKQLYLNKYTEVNNGKLPLTLGKLREPPSKNKTFMTVAYKKI